MFALFISLGIPGVGELIEQGTDLLGGDDYDAAQVESEVFSCDREADPDLAQQLVLLAEADSGVRGTLDDMISQLTANDNWGGSPPSTLQEKACYWSYMVQIDWPGAGTRVAQLRDDLLDAVEGAADLNVEPGEEAFDADGGGVGDQLLGILEDILQPEEIERRLEGAAAGAQAGARSPGIIDQAVPFAILAGVLLLAFAVFRS